MNWYEDDELWSQFYQQMFNAESFKIAEFQVPQLISMVNHPIDSILDLACGPGRHCLALKKMGYQIDGVDISPYLLEKANQVAKQQSLKINFINEDMLRYKAEHQYDLIINMFNSFGYHDSQQKNQQVIQQAFDNLKDTGSLIIDTVGKETLARNIQAVHLTEYDNGDIRIERPLLVDNLQVFSNEWMLIKGDKVFRREYQHYVYTPLEISNMCYKAGFDNVRIYGSLCGEDYDLESEQMVVVAEKGV
jgi:SAM-dependent methyltransferase